MPTLRLIPVVLFATVSLLAIKTIGFLGPGPDLTQQSAWSLESEIRKRLQGGASADDLILTGSADVKPDAKDAPPMAALPTASAPAKGAAPASGSAAERALIERLQERRQELEARARDLEMRESLLKAAEKQLDGRIGELKAAEGTEGQATDRIKSLVVMYESMGPKEAARIFDRLEPRTLVDLVNAMNPRKVSEIMAKMQPEAAERMTLELARGRSAQALPPTDLKRIDASTPR